MVFGCVVIWASTVESDAFSVLCPWPDSVCTASQTRAAMTISGKSALRKNRFKGPLDAGYQPRGRLKLGRIGEFRRSRPVDSDGHAGNPHVLIAAPQAVP